MTFLNIIELIRKNCNDKIKITVIAHNGSHFDTIILLKSLFKKYSN
jgi:hypothetical protein